MRPAQGRLVRNICPSQSPRCPFPVTAAGGQGEFFCSPSTHQEEKGVRRMRFPAKRLYAAAIALCLLAGARARADFVSWEYNWTPSATEILADNPTTGKILLSNEPGGSAVGNTYIVATNIKTASNSDPSTPATFTNKAYSLALTILDDASGKTGTMTFSGTF